MEPLFCPCVILTTYPGSEGFARKTYPYDQTVKWCVISWSDKIHPSYLSLERSHKGLQYQIHKNMDYLQESQMPKQTSFLLDLSVVVPGWDQGGAPFSSMCHSDYVSRIRRGSLERHILTIRQWNDMYFHDQIRSSELSVSGAITQRTTVPNPQEHGLPTRVTDAKTNFFPFRFIGRSTWLGSRWSPFFVYVSFWLRIHDQKGLLVRHILTIRQWNDVYFHDQIRFIRVICLWSDTQRTTVPNPQEHGLPTRVTDAKTNFFPFRFISRSTWLGSRCSPFFVRVILTTYPGSEGFAHKTYPYDQTVKWYVFSPSDNTH